MRATVLLPAPGSPIRATTQARPVPLPAIGAGLSSASIQHLHRAECAPSRCPWTGRRLESACRRPLAAMPYLKLPFQIPGYRIIRRLGSGGMATVWLATQESLSRPVAVKVLAGERTPGEELVRRFENEARVIAQLVHPHIVGIFDVGRTSNGQIYYTMPYLPRG